MRKFLTIASSFALLLSLAGPAGAATRAVDGSAARAPRSDNHAGPLTGREDARRTAAMELVLSGKASPNRDGVVKLADDKYFQAAVTGTGQVFTILSEFGDAGSGKLGTDPGPVHNEIAKPNRQVVDGAANPDYNPALPYDNFKHWTADFNTAYYDDLFFGDGDSFADFYDKLSGGNYTVAGDVSDWVQVPNNASTYGDNKVEDFGGAWQFIEDSGNAWYQAQKTAGWNDAQINAYLAQFDVWDRYDHDNDGNFDEPDGYIDHFQAVHAGEGEDAGGGPQGADAIWSHRWYVNQTDFGQTGPSADAMFGGAHIGNSNYWIGDYTVEAENGGLGVFAHEFGHDLGLPDLYDTNAGENGTAFWTLMSSGSWLNEGTEDIGTKPDYYGAWERLQLGWLSDYSVVNKGESGSFSLGPSEAVIVDLPDEGIETSYTTPYTGSQMWWSTSADDLNTTLTHELDLSGVRSATVSARAWYDIEAGFDYLHAEYSTDNGDTWTQLGTPVTGDSKGHWKTIKYTVPGGAPVLFRYRFQSDGGVHLANVFLDDVSVKSGGTILFEDPVDDADGWTADGGFRLSTGTETTIGDKYYIAENRSYVGYDATLETGPYQFSFATDPDKVEHFAFQDGLLVWLVDETYSDNNTSEHPGHGLTLPVDARPDKFTYPDGSAPSNRRQPFDATFGLQDVPAGPTFDPENPGTPFACGGLHKQVVVGKGQDQHIEVVCAWPTAEERQAIAVFDDTDVDGYWLASNPQGSTKVAGEGVTIEVTNQVSGGAIDVDVNYPAGG